jgi:tRNA1(Val) A37 N6-methylase TrmN6
MNFELTIDAFLSGAINVAQPKTGYRAGIDPILLAASIPAKSGQSILELGCGVGTASLALAHRVHGVSITAVEIQAVYADLARKNVLRNCLNINVVEADLSALPEDVRSKQFDHVFANPPYFNRTSTSASADEGRDRAMGERDELPNWLDAAAKRVKPKGYAHFIFRTERLDEFLSYLPASLGSRVITPIVPRTGRESTLFLAHARKNGRSAFRLESPLVLHDGEFHKHDGDDYSQKISNVLRNGDTLTDWFRE